MSIKGVSDKRRFSILGRIRLGVRRKTESGKEYPSKVDYFILDAFDPAVKDQCVKLYGDKPRKLTIAFPDDDVERIFPQYYECWSKAALLCKGDGEAAQRNDAGTLTPCDCPGPDMCQFAIAHGTKDREGNVTPGCKRVARLQCVLVDLDTFGVFRLDTGSFNSIVNVNSALEFVRKVYGRVSWIPLDMVLKSQRATHEGKQINIYVVDILLPVGLREVANLKPMLEYAQERQIKQLDAPPVSPPEDLLPAEDAFPDYDAETGEVIEPEQPEPMVTPEPPAKPKQPKQTKPAKPVAPPPTPSQEPADIGTLF